MPPKQDPSYDPLPDIAALPGEDQRFYNDMYGDAQVPQEVAADVSTMPEIPQTGMRFDFGSLNVQTKEDFAALPEEQKELLRAMKRGVQFTPESAAKFVLGQRERQQKLQDSASSPQAVAETDAAFARAQKAYNTTKKIDYALKRVIGKDAKNPRYSSYVGAYSVNPLKYVPGTETRQFKNDLDSLKALLGLAAAGDNKGQGQVSNYERELYAAASSVGLDIANTGESFGATLEQIKQQNDAQLAENEAVLNKLQGKKPDQSGQQQTQQAPLQTKTIGNQTWVRKPEGWVPQR